MPWQGTPVALLWEQSLVWGLICIDTLQRLGVPFHLLSSDDVGSGKLERYRLLLVPGGWASHKVRALGEPGKKAIKRFIERGGSYLGFCGGAGLALSSPPSLGLVPLQRMPFSERLPNASGEVWIRGNSDHPAWKDLPHNLPVSIWWPSQFSLEHLRNAVPLATYSATGADFRVADFCITDLQGQDVSWEDREKIYGINLDPGKILGHPAILEVESGKGKLILSYAHLETPDEEWANRLFLNFLTYLDGEASRHLPDVSCFESRQIQLNTSLGRETVARLVRIHEKVDEFIQFGERHLFWGWRRPWLLHWRRGIRGLEYGTLAVTVRAALHIVREISEDCGSRGPFTAHSENTVSCGSRQAETALGHYSHERETPATERSGCGSLMEPVKKLEADVDDFCRTAKRLLLEEKLSAQTGNLTKLGKVNESVDRLRGQLFGSRMNHGGLCRTLFDELDTLLLQLLRLQLIR